jgi:hypothetical protein
MRYKDLPDGKLFIFSPQPGHHETALKVGKRAYLLRTGELIDVHASRACEEIRPLKGDRYRLGVNQENELTIFSQANDTQVFTYEFLVIGHRIRDRREIKPIMGKVEREEFQQLVNIILTKFDANIQQARNLLNVLRDSLFEDFNEIKLT